MGMTESALVAVDPGPCINISRDGHSSFIHSQITCQTPAKVHIIRKYNTKGGKDYTAMQLLFGDAIFFVKRKNADGYLDMMAWRRRGLVSLLANCSSISMDCDRSWSSSGCRR